MRDRSGKDLVEAAKRGSRMAYAELVKEHTRRVYAICLGLTGNIYDAEDAAQETLVKGFTGLATLSDNGKFRLWINTIAKNQCRDLIRGKIRMRNALLEKTRQTSDHREYEPSAEQEKLKKAISLLDPRYRQPLLLYYYQGQDCAGIAQTLGIENATVRSRLSRARQKLRELLTLTEMGGQNDLSV